MMNRREGGKIEKREKGKKKKEKDKNSIKMDKFEFKVVLVGEGNLFPPSIPLTL